MPAGIMGALWERSREGPPTLAEEHKIYDDQCKKEQREITPAVERPDATSASPRAGVAAGALRDTWPGPLMKNQATGKRYEEWEMWALAEELVDLAIGRLGLTGEDDWSDYTLPTTPSQSHTQWDAEAWSAYYETLDWSD